MYCLFALFLLLLGCNPTPKALHFDESLVRPYTFDLEKQKHLEAPYVAQYQKGNKHLYYVASEHISTRKYPNVVEHPTLKTIKKIFEEFRPQVVIVEGIDTGDKLSPESLLKHADKCEKTSYKSGCGESFYAINQAREMGSQFVSGEPLHQKVKEELLKLDYKVEDLLGFYLIRQIPQWKRQKIFNKETFEEMANNQLARFEKMIDSQTLFNFEKFDYWYSSKMSKPRSYLDIKNDDPAPHGGNDATYVQKISHYVTLLRDREVVQRIEAMLNQFDRVLIIYGGSHLVIQEPAINKALGQPKYIKFF